MNKKNSIKEAINKIFDISGNAIWALIDDSIPTIIEEISKRLKNNDYTLYDNFINISVIAPFYLLLSDNQCLFIQKRLCEELDYDDIIVKSKITPNNTLLKIKFYNNNNNNNNKLKY